ncbi:MAG: ABC transporter permease [Acidimicrobiaceae bacterium]|nr:ABC transporter permease [Acidimicrobiaceae bacterium]
MVLRSFLDNKLAVIGITFVVIMVIFCFIGPHFYHTDQVNTSYNINLPPGKGHPLGTDENGRDVLGRLMVGGQSSLEIGFAVAIIATFIGVLYGAISGFLGGIVDTVMMRLVDVMLAIPTLFILIYLASIFKPTIKLLIVVISLVSWLGPARLVRGEALSLRVREYVKAVRVMGGGSRRIILRHIIPNTIGTIVVNATFQVADAILVMASLSFLGLGIPPPAANWGGMLSNGVNFIYDGYWWLIYPAGLAIVITVVAFNFIGDALRDALEVRLQKR